MGAEERFLADLAAAIRRSGGSSRFTPAGAEALAAKVLLKLREIGPFAYPSLLDEEGLRFVYQWDQQPPVLTVMLWNDELWQDMERVAVPTEIDEQINQ